MWWTWHIISIITYPILKVLLFLPLVILQAIVYSLLLLFLHPRPEPRTMSLVETVSLCSRAGFLFVSCLTIWSLCYWLWNFNCTLLVIIRRCSSFAVFRTISSTYCGCWLVPDTSNDHLVTNSPVQQANTIAWSYHTSCTQNEISNIFHHMRMQAQGFHSNNSCWYRVVTVFEKQQKQKTTP